MPDELDVRLRGRTVGVLTKTRNGARFRYTDQIINSSPGVPLLSAALPVGPGEQTPERTAAWFTGLLPEDRQREEVQRRFGLQSGSYFDLLREIGWECAGAVTIGADRSTDVPSLLPLSPPELAERLAALPSHPFDDTSALRVSLGGFQSKLLVTRSAGGGWSLPLNGEPSTHILKPQPSDRYRNLVAAEAWGMSVAAAVTPTAESRLLGDESAPVTLVVTRFDRTGDGGEIERIHQEDAAQAMGVPPEHKYASSGSPSRSDPTLRGVALVLERYALDPLAQRTRLLQQLTVNTALGNTDAHAKNYGILHLAPGQLQLSPMYDVVPATFVNPAQREMGMRIAGVLRVDRVDASTLLAEARSWGMPEAAALATVSDTLDRLSGALDAASDRYPDAPAGLHEHVSDRIAALRVA